MSADTTTRTYEQALKQGRTAGASCATDAQAMALFLDSSIQLLCGAVSPKLVWEGAQKRGLSFRELGALAHTDPATIEELMWE